jgi:hypothetical protein
MGDHGHFYGTVVGGEVLDAFEAILGVSLLTSGCRVALDIDALKHRAIGDGESL